MDVPVSGKVAERGLLKKVEFRVDSAQVRPYSDQAFDNLYMFDLVAVSLFRFILSPKRGLKPGSRLVPVNMSNDTMHKTLYERIYKAACLLPRHPVVMESYAQSSFLDV